MNHPYTKPAGLSLFVHIALPCLAALLAGQAGSTPRALDPPPIEIEIEPSRLIDMGSGRLQLTSGSPPPMRAAKPRIRIAAAGPTAPEPTPSGPPPASAPTSLDQPPPPLAGEINETSVAVPLPGDKEAAGGSGSGAGGASGGGRGARRYRRRDRQLCRRRRRRRRGLHGHRFPLWGASRISRCREKNGPGGDRDGPGPRGHGRCSRVGDGTRHERS
jgi:hypothetical protein